MPAIAIKADVTGKVWKLEATAGANVATGDVVMILESMKMEIPVEAPRAGRLASIAVTEGDSVKEGQVLATLEA